MQLTTTAAQILACVWFHLHLIGELFAQSFCEQQRSARGERTPWLWFEVLLHLAAVPQSSTRVSGHWPTMGQRTFDTPLLAQPVLSAPSHLDAQHLLVERSPVSEMFPPACPLFNREGSPHAPRLGGLQECPNLIGGETSEQVNAGGGVAIDVPCNFIFNGLLLCWEGCAPAPS